MAFRRDFGTRRARHNRTSTESEVWSFDEETSLWRPRFQGYNPRHQPDTVVCTPYSSNPKHAVLESNFKNDVDSPKSVFGLVDSTLFAAEGERDLAKAIKIDILGCYTQF